MANRRRKDLTDIEKAREFGRQSLEDAETGKLQRAISENEVRGIAEIPYLDGSSGWVQPDNASSVAVGGFSSIPSIRTVQPIGGNRDISYEMERMAREAEQQRYANLTSQDRARLNEIDADMRRLASKEANNRASGGMNARRISGLSSERNRLLGQNLSQNRQDQSAVMDKWLDSNYKMTDSEVEQAKQIIRDYENTEYKNSNIYNLTKDEQSRQSQINALKDKVSKVSAAEYGVMNATINPLLVAGDNDYYGWTADDLYDEVSRQKDITSKLSPEVKTEVGRLQSEIQDLQNRLNSRNTVYSTGDAGVDEVTGATTTYRNAAEIRSDLEDKRKQMYKLMLEGAKEENTPDYESYSLRKANAQKQNPVEYTTSDLATRMIESAAIQGAVGSNGFAADMLVDALTDTLPEYATNRASGMSRKDAGNQALASGALNTLMNGGAWGLSNLDNIIPRVHDYTVKNELRRTGHSDLADVIHPSEYMPPHYENSNGVTPYSDAMRKNLTSESNRVNDGHNFFDFVKESLDDRSNNKGRFYFGTVSDELGADTKASTPYDLSGFNITINRGAIQHSKNDHPQLTPEQISKLAAVFDKPDDIFVSPVHDYANREAIEFSKRINGYLYTVAGISDGRKNLDIDSFTISKRNPLEIADHGIHNPAPSLTPEAQIKPDSLSTSTIDQIDESVKNAKKNNRWGNAADRLIPEDSYARTDEFRQLEQQRYDLYNERDRLESDIKALHRELESESTPKPESEWNADDKLLSMMGYTPESYTEKGQIIQDKINEMSGRVKDLNSQISSLDDSLNYRRAQERLAQLENYQVVGITPATRSDYTGFSTESASGRYDDYVKEGKAVLAEMSPEEYLRRCAYEIFGYDGHETFESMVSSRSQKDIDNLIAEIRKGTKLDAPYLDYRDRGQEGIHRALAAYELGIDKIPVVVRGTPDTISDLGFEARKLIHDADYARSMADIDKKLEELEIDDVDLLDFDEITPDLPSMPTQDLDAIKRVESTDGGDIVPPNGGRDIPATTPEQPSGDKLSRYATNTMRRGTNLTPEEYAEQDLSQFMYESKTEKQSMEDAFRMIEEEGTDNLKARLMAEEAKDLTQSETDALMSLIRTNNATIRALRFEGKLDEAAALRAETTAMNKKVRQQASSNAQGLQALAKWTRNTPEGMLMHAENIVSGNVKTEKSALQEALDKLKRSRKDVEFSPEFEDKFLEEAEKLMEIGDMDSREAKDIMARLGRLVNDQIPVKLNEKVQAFLMDNMLGNFRTLITRNAGGNVGLNAMEQTMTRPLAAAIDRLVARKTGRRTQAGMTKEALSDYIQGFKKGLSDEAHDLKTGLHTARTGENTLEEAIRSNRHVFKNRVQDKLDSLVKNGLSVGDRPFYEATYKQTIGDYYRLREQGVMGDAIQNLSDEAFEQYADVAANLNALAAVYQNNSKMAEALMGLKNGIGDLSEGMVGFDILSQFSMPFVKTPANVVDRAIDYSPLGIIRNIARTAKEGGIGGENFDQNRFVNETARNIIGTGLMGGGAAAAKAGGLSGSYSDDLDEKRVQKESGMQEYALNLPNDMQMDVGWIPVLGSNAVAAAAAYDAYRKNKGDGVGSAIAKGLAEGGQALFDQSMFQGLQRLFGTGESYNSEGTLPENLMNVVKQGLGQAIPSLVRQGAQVSDQYQRDLSGSNKDWSLGPIDNYTINSWANNIPFVRKAVLNPKVDSEGNFIEESQGRGLGSRILEDMFLPGKLTQVDYTRLNEEAQRLSDITGNTTSFMPRASRSKLDTDEHTLTNKEWLDFQQKYYSDMDTAGNALMDSQAYQAADDATKEEMMTDLFKAVSDATNATVTGKDISGAAKEFRDNNVEGLLKYVEAKNNPYKIEREAYQKMVDSGTDMSAYEGYGDALTANGVEDKAAYRNAYASGVTPEEKAANLQDEVQYQAALKEYELSDSDAVRAAWDKALHASSDPNYALQQLAQSRENAKDLGFVNSDGGINSAAYDKAMSVIGDDPNTLSSYASFKTSMSGLGTARETYLPKLEAMPGLSNAQKGQFAYLYGGAPKAGSSADQVLNSDYGYEGYYDYLMIQNSPDLNNNGKAHDKGDRIKYMYDVLGWDDSDDIYKYFVGLNY